jgi:ATP/maltotriose-dependent transcriptional regulator MalT
VGSVVLPGGEIGLTSPDHQTLYPPVRPELVSCPRLVEQLIAALVLDDKYRGLHRKLTLISAPAGFGKTTLVKVVRSGAD